MVWYSQRQVPKIRSFFLCWGAPSSHYRLYWHMEWIRCSSANTL